MVFAADNPQPSVKLEDYIFYVYLKSNEIIKVEHFAKGGGEKELWAATSSGQTRKFAVADILGVKVAKREPVPDPNKDNEEAPTKTLLDINTNPGACIDKRMTINPAVLTPSTYFNYGYLNERSDYIAFEIQGQTGREYVYVKKTWEASEKLRQRILSDDSVIGLFTVIVSLSHYDSQSPDMMAELVGYRIPKK